MASCLLPQLAMRPLLTCVAVVLALAGIASRAEAAPILYEVSGVASGQIGGTSFSNVLVRFAGLGDTANIVTGDFGGTLYANRFSALTVSIGGFGTATITDASDIISIPFALPPNDESRPFLSSSSGESILRSSIRSNSRGWELWAAACWPATTSRRPSAQLPPSAASDSLKIAARRVTTPACTRRRVFELHHQHPGDQRRDVQGNAGPRAGDVVRVSGVGVLVGGQGVVRPDLPQRIVRGGFHESRVVVDVVKSRGRQRQEMPPSDWLTTGQSEQRNARASNGVRSV